MTGDIIDRRRYPRFNVEHALFIEVVERGSRSEGDNTIIRCETIDISAAGLRVSVPVAIAQGSTLNIAVPMEDWQESLELVGEAKWVKPAEQGDGYWVGLSLQDSNRQDMEKWFKVVQKLKARPETPPD